MGRFWATLAAALLLTVSPAFGHAVLLDSQPADGATLSAAPSQVQLRFSEPVTVTDLRVLGPAGAVVVGPDGVAGGGDAWTLPLPADLGDGSFLVSYHVTSADAHPVSGSLLFAIGRAADPALRQAVHDDGALAVAAWLARLVFYVGLLGSVGGALFRLLVVRRPLPAGPSVLVVLGIAAAISGVALRGATLGSGGWAALADPAAWQTGFGTTLGLSALAAVGGLSLIALGGRALPAIGVVIALASLVLTGHAVTAGPAWLTVPVLLVHGAGVAFWFGALWPLYGVVGRDGVKAAPLLHRFSRLAVPLVAMLVAAGLVTASLQLRAVAPLVTTAYGRLLLIKLAVVALLILLAARNRLQLTPALAAGDPRTGRRLQQAILAELACAAVVLGATAALGTIPPPRVADAIAMDHAAHEAAGHPSAFAVTAESGNYRVEAVLDSGATGERPLTLRFTGLQPREVSVRIALPSANVAPLVRLAAVQPDGSWRVDVPGFVIPGLWSLRIEALVSDFEQAVFSLDLPVGRPG